MAQDKPVTLAAVIGAHGVTGEVRLKLFGEGLEALKRHKSFNDGALTLTKAARRRQGRRDRPLCRSGRPQRRRGAARHRADRPALGLPPLDEGEYYHADLIGLPAVSDAGEPLGTVVAVENFGAGDVLEIERPPADGKPGKRFMVPMTEAACPNGIAKRWSSQRYSPRSSQLGEDGQLVQPFETPYLPWLVHRATV